MRTKWINAEFQILNRLTATVTLEIKKTEVWSSVTAGLSVASAQWAEVHCVNSVKVKHVLLPGELTAAQQGYKVHKEYTFCVAGKFPDSYFLLCISECCN